MNSFNCIFVCVYQALQNSLVYTISVISVFASYTYVCYVLVYFVLYVYNCMHKRTIKYLVSCILTLDLFQCGEKCSPQALSYAERPDYLPDCIAIVY